MFYLYFINLDNKYIKFGTTKNLDLRLSTHRKKFVDKNKISNSLYIKNIIAFDSDILCRRTEKRLKEYLRDYQINIKIYDETEIILYNYYDFFFSKINIFIDSINRDINIKNNNVYLYNRINNT